MPKLVDHNQRKAVIAEATYHVIQRYGFENTTMRKIAEDAGLSLGAIQYYFPTQRDIYIFAMELLLERMEERIVYSVKDGDPAFEGVVRMLKQLIPLQDQDQRTEIEAWLSFALMALKDPTLGELSSKIYDSTLEFMKYMFKILHDHGCLGRPINIETESVNLYAFIDGLTLQSILYPNLFDEQMVENRIQDYLRNVCACKV